MTWATHHIARLKAGETVTFKTPNGRSMIPRVNPKQVVTCAPITSPPTKGDVVLCKVGRAQCLHLVSAVQGDRFQISNNHGHVNGWITLSGIFGKLVE